MPEIPRIEMLNVGDGAEARSIAAIFTQPAHGPSDLTLVWLGGYRSDMTGSKALELEALSGRLGVNCLRFDYSGHGASGGDFMDGTITRWLEEALAVVHHWAKGRLLLVGSSMGGWIALRAVEELKATGYGARLAGLVLVAPAPDFTAELVEPNLTEAEFKSLQARGFFEEPSDYSAEPSIFTRKLLEDGRNNRVLDGIIETNCPVHILQGMKDPDVPYQHALRLLAHLPSDEVVMTLIADGDHRLSRPQDLARLCDAVTAMVAAA